MGPSVKLSYSASVKEFKKIMLDKFGFAENSEVAQSEILVEYFEDQFEEEQASVKSLMEVLRKLKESALHDQPKNVFPTSTFICCSKRRFTPNDFYNPPPEYQLRFWKEVQSWTEDHPDEKYLKFFRPTFFQATT